MFKISDPALTAFLQSWFTGMGRTGALDALQVACFRALLTDALAAMHQAEPQFLTAPAVRSEIDIAPPA